MANELTCGWYLEKFSLLYDYYAFFDTKDYLADSLFIKHKVRVHFMEEYAHPDAEYRVIFCKCRKRDSEAFRAALDELTDKMLICGHRDYPEFSRQMKQKMGADRKQRHKKEREERGAVDTVEKAEQESAERVLSKAARQLERALPRHTNRTEPKGL